MILALGFLPFLTLLISAIVLCSSGRTLSEKITLFIVSPDDTDKGSANFILGLRICFWASLLACLWIISITVMGIR